MNTGRGNGPPEAIHRGAAVVSKEAKTMQILGPLFAMVVKQMIIKSTSLTYHEGPEFILLFFCDFFAPVRTVQLGWCIKMWKETQINNERVQILRCHNVV